MIKKIEKIEAGGGEISKEEIHAFFEEHPELPHRDEKRAKNKPGVKLDDPETWGEDPAGVYPAGVPLAPSGLDDLEWNGGRSFLKRGDESI